MFSQGPFTRAQAQILKDKLQDPQFKKAELVNLLQDIISFYYVTFQGLQTALPRINAILEQEIIPLYTTLLEILEYYIDAVNNKQATIDKLACAVEKANEERVLSRDRVEQLLGRISELEQQLHEFTTDSGDPALRKQLNDLIAERKNLYKIIINLKKQPSTRSRPTQTMDSQGASTSLAVTIPNSMEKLELINSIPNFSIENGTPSLGEFLNTIDLFSRVGNWSDRTTVDVAKIKIVGSAGVSVRSEDVFTNAQTWQQFRAALVSRFTPIELYTTTNLKLITCCQQQNESVQNFAARLSAVTNNLTTQSTDPRESEIRKKLVDEQKLLYFIQGLQPALKNYVLLSNPKTFEAAVQSARKYEPHLMITPVPSPQQNSPQINTVDLSENNLERMITQVLAKMQITPPTNHVCPAPTADHINMLTKGQQNFRNNKNWTQPPQQNPNYPRRYQAAPRPQFSNAIRPYYNSSNYNNNRSQYNGPRQPNNRFSQNNLPREPPLTKSDLNQFGYYFGKMLAQMHTAQRPEHQNQNAAQTRQARTNITRQNLRCYNCNKMGHIARECRSQQTPPPGRKLLAIEWPDKTSQNSQNASN